MVRTIDLKESETEPEPQREEPKEDVLIGEPRALFLVDTMSWNGPSYYKRTDGRYANYAGLILIVLAVLVQIFGDSTTTSVLLFLIAILIMINSRKAPLVQDYSIDPVEIVAGPKTYKHTDVVSFWIDYIPELDVSELSLQLQRWYLPYVKIPLQNQDAVQVRNILIEFIPESEHHDTAADTIGKILGI